MDIGLFIFGLVQAGVAFLLANGRALLPDAGEGAPCDGARPHLMVPGDVIEDADRLEALARATADALPTPKPKRAKRS
mgnify:CR=1 FL=1